VLGIGFAAPQKLASLAGRAVMLRDEFLLAAQKAFPDGQTSRKSRAAGLNCDTIRGDWNSALPVVLLSANMRNANQVKVVSAKSLINLFHDRRGTLQYLRCTNERACTNYG
jgi:hypothetical protein